jgi:hypothetical protein
LDVLESGRYTPGWVEISYNSAEAGPVLCGLASQPRGWASLSLRRPYETPFLGEEKVAALAAKASRPRAPLHGALDDELEVARWREVAEVLSDEEWAAMWATLYVRDEVAAACAAWEKERGGKSEPQG